MKVNASSLLGKFKVSIYFVVGVSTKLFEVSVSATFLLAVETSFWNCIIEAMSSAMEKLGLRFAILKITSRISG